MYEGEVTELTPEETENQSGEYGKVIQRVVIGLRTVKGSKQLRLDPSIYDSLQKEKVQARPPLSRYPLHLPLPCAQRSATPKTGPGIAPPGNCAAFSTKKNAGQFPAFFLAGTAGYVGEPADCARTSGRQKDPGCSFMGWEGVDRGIVRSCCLTEMIALLDCDCSSQAGRSLQTNTRWGRGPAPDSSLSLHGDGAHCRADCSADCRANCGAKCGAKCVANCGGNCRANRTGHLA